jgi:hypothetical protein
MIKDPTRITKTSKTLIDLALTDIKYCTSSGILNYNISDHKPIFIVKKKPRNNKLTKTCWGRYYNNYSQENLKNTLKELNTQAILLETDPTKCWDLIEEMIYEILDRLCPLGEMKGQVHTAAYLNSELLDLQQDRDH